MIKLFSEESVEVQTKGSPLANELVSIFQSVIDYRETIETVAQRVKEVPLFFKTKAVPKIQTAIKKYTGLDCTSIRLSKNIDMGFACLMMFGDKYGLTANSIIERYSGLDPDPMIEMYMRELNIKPATAADMRQVAESLNRVTGKFGVDRMANNIKCTMSMYFDPYGAFLLKECAHQKFDYLTADEITGIVLHEIGHMVSCLAHSADLYFRIQVYNRSMDYFLKTASRKEKLEFIKEGIWKVDPAIAEKAGQAIDKCTAVDGSEDQGSWVANVIGWFFDALALVMETLLLIPFIHILFDAFTAIGKELSPDSVWNSLDPKKHSDFYGLDKQLKVCEQFADEYVARHGMSRGQINALNKLWSFAEYSLSFGAMLGGSTTSSIAYYINKIPFVIMTFLYGDMTGGGLYDEKTARAQRLVQETIKAFKQQLSPEMADYYMNDYVQAKTYAANKSGYDRYRDAMQWIKNAINYLISSLPAMLVSGRFSAEYEKLFNQAEKLINNSLFFRATKLESLLRKK